MEIKDLERYEMWLYKGIDLVSRKLSIIGDIDEFNLTEYIRAIDLLEAHSNDPIRVDISSFGGCVYTGLALYDRLSSCSCTVHTHCIGKAMSMGFIIFLAGDIRTCSENATFMNHQVSSASIGKVVDMETDVEESKRVEKICLSITANKTKKDLKWWSKEIEYKDKYYNKKKAIELGIVNEK